MIQKTSILGVAFVFLEVCTFGSTSNISTLNNDTAATSVINTIPPSIYHNETTKNFETEPATTTLSSTLSLEDSFKLPETCADYKLLGQQPNASTTATIKKCCPLHQSYIHERGKRQCRNSSHPFEVQAIRAKFYENCIEDEENVVNLNITIDDSCKKGLMFNKNFNDTLYVIQNGSLLRIDANFESFDVFEHYCLDMDESEGILTAIVCEFDDMLSRVNKAQALIFATCMLISVPCLLLTATIYLLVPELNDLHGKSLACHSISLSLGFLLLALSQFHEMLLVEGYIIQFLILACFFWLTVMWIDICIHAWYYLPRGIKQTPKDDNLHLMYYGLFAYGLPIILVILTYKNKLTGLPSYYLKGNSEVARTSQTFFIPPISFSLLVNLLLYISSFFGFKKLQKTLRLKQFLMLQMKECARENKLSSNNIDHIEKVVTIMKSTAYLTIIMTVNWIFEIISFYNETSSTFFDIVNALQGVFILFIFVCLPRPTEIIKSWWKDRGSYRVVTMEKPQYNELQMSNLKQ